MQCSYLSVSRTNVPTTSNSPVHASRDRILLEGDDVLSSDEQEEEVFGLKGLSDTDSDEDDVEDEGIADEDAEDIDHPSKKPRAKASKKAKKSVSAPSTSSSGSEESEEEGWGGKKSAYYSSNAAIIESDDEEANELEEQEARRLQAKARASMSEADFGLDDIAEVTAAADEEMEYVQPLIYLPLKLIVFTVLLQRLLQLYLFRRISVTSSAIWKKLLRRLWPWHATGKTLPIIWSKPKKKLPRTSVDFPFLNCELMWI